MENFFEDKKTTDRRMKALESLDILDTPPESDFDDIVLLATQLCDVPVALVSLVTDNRQWFKARVGFAPCETSLDQSVCKFAMSGDDLLVIPDLTADPRTKDNTLVTEDPHIRFYAGAPIRDRDGTPIGSLCVIDTKTRAEGLSEKQQAGLKSLSQIVMAAIDARRYYNLKSEQRDAERAAIAAELTQARQTAEMREHFAAVLSHDLRNPLSAIIGGLNVIEAGLSPDHTRKMLTMMRQSTIRMTELIESTLDLTRTKLGGGIDIQNIKGDVLLSVLDQIVQEVRSAHPRHAIETRFDLSGDIACDSARIGQLFSNLLANAVTHGDSGMPVTVTAASSDGIFHLSVANGGRPIPEDKLDTLFQPYKGSESGAYAKGLGLGLYIVMEIANAHGAKMTAMSTGERTEFVFQMPLEPSRNGQEASVLQS